MRHKYGAKPTTIDNIKFASRAEAAYYNQLKIRKIAKDILAFDLQPEYVLLKPFKKNGRKYPGIKYKADFLVTNIDGTQEVIDVKGVETPVYKLKRQMFENLYPHLTIVEVKA